MLMKDKVNATNRLNEQELLDALIELKYKQSEIEKLWLLKLLKRWF